MEKKNSLIDFTFLLDFCDHEESFILEMIETFLDTVPQELQKMADSITENQWEDFCRSAHTLKTSAKLIGAVSLADAMYDLEQKSSSQKKLAQLSASFHYAETLAQKVLALLVKERANPSFTKKG